MKIVVIGPARSGSTKLSLVIGDHFASTQLCEIVKYGMTTEERTSTILALRNQDNFCVKFWPSHINGLLHLIDWGDIDIIVASNRESIVDSYISCWIAMERRQWIKYKSDQWENSAFSVDVTDESICAWYNNFVILHKTVLTDIQTLTGRPVPMFTYDCINDNNLLSSRLAEIGINVNSSQINTGDIIPTGNNYKIMCQNYLDVEEAFARLGLA